MRLRSFIVAVAVVVAATPARPQQTSLPSDAEYAGALLTSTQPVQFMPSGRLRSGTLKSDYARGGFVFAAGTIVTFHENGAVIGGVLKQDASSGKYLFTAGPITFHPNGAVQSGWIKPGTADANLTFPVEGQVGLEPEGRITSFAPRASTPYRVLDRTLSTVSSFRFDPATQNYSLVSGNAGLPQLIARVAVKWNEEGLPVQSIPVIVPAGSSFKFFNNLIPGDFDGQWFVTNFTLNGMNFGPTPTLFVRDMRLWGVRVAGPIQVGGFQYQGGDMVVFDAAGRIVPPQR